MSRVAGLIFLLIACCASSPAAIAADEATKRPVGTYAIIQTNVGDIFCILYDDKSLNTV